jgi:hypothetical protein
MGGSCSFKQWHIVLLRSQGIDKFSIIKLCITIQVESANDGHQQVVIGEVRASYEETLEIDAVNIVCLGLIHLVEESGDVVFGVTCQHLLLMLYLLCEFELLRDKLAQKFLNVEGEVLLVLHLVSLTLSSVRSQHILVTWQHHLQEV